MNNETCHEHSGCIQRLTNLEKDNIKQWEEIVKVDDKTNSIMTRLNVVLGSIVVACVMLLLNLVIKF